MKQERQLSVWRVAVYVLAALVGPFAGTLLAEHRAGLEWMSEYFGPPGEGRCCGINDCIPVQASLLEEPQGETVTVYIDYLKTWDRRVIPAALELTVDVRRVHRSEDTIGYWCHQPTYRINNDPPADQTCGPPDYAINAGCLRCLFIPVGS